MNSDTKWKITVLLHPTSCHLHAWDKLLMHKMSHFISTYTHFQLLFCFITGITLPATLMSVRVACQIRNNKNLFQCVHSVSRHMIQ